MMWEMPSAQPTKSFHVDFLAEAVYEPRDAFVYAASLNQVEVVRRWIGKKMDVNDLDKEGNHALYMASQNESLEVLELLLSNGARVNHQQRDGKTALHAACTWGKIEAAQILLAHEAEIQSRDNDGQVPLHYACRNGHEELVQLLLNSDVDLFVGDQFGATPIDVARDWQRLDILNMLEDTRVGGRLYLAYRTTAFRDANYERVEIAVNGINNQMDVPQGICDIIADCLC